ncbi:MAG: hypothetical protein ABIO19_02755 [Burkholderiaceae bacterium]
MHFLIKARQIPIKFVVIICIVVSLELVVSIAKVGDADLHNLVCPAVLLRAVVAMMGLGIYQKRSAAIEAKDRQLPPPEKSKEIAPR